MIVDFHTHTYPDKIAGRAIKKLAIDSNVDYYRDGTYRSLVESAKTAGIDYCVSLPVATAVRQVESINNLSEELNGKNGIIYAGAIHPDCTDIDAVLDFIKSAGLKVIKIHPDYQGTRFDSEKYLRILEGAAKRNIITVTHAGVDLGFPNDIHCTPQMIVNVLNELEGIIDNKLVLAHLGANDYPDEVISMIAGRPVYFDTAFSLARYPQKATEIIKAHGAEKVLFATDSPWADQKKFTQLLRSLDITENEKNLILGENAKRILSL